MQYLLIDFGATFIKCCIFDTESNTIDSIKSIESPFLNTSSLSKSELIKLITEILDSHPSCKRVMSCSILGGEWIADTYHSWKVLKYQSKPDCLLSGLFIGQDTYHIHHHHGGNVQNIKILGKINDVIFYSSLGDTNCIVESMDIQEEEYIINMGTGSQVITKNDIHKYIPCGRALLVFASFFKSLQIDMFEQIKQIKIQDVIDANLEINLNVFEQAHKYLDGGSILKIQENNFTPTNLFASILKSLVCQYKPFIHMDDYTIRLTGGIPQKIPLVKEIFEYYYNNPIIHIDSNFETHIGLSKFINYIEE